ncbi:hypothetical protein [Convivina intestini]|uniref:hypothetical protein n=1 Tax=Convivina intestini TaxID=1505726 RepID=UPI00200EBD70|nr:hypothetical protein [Convivina intestini]CAH1855113.1 hypothetical protein R078131_01127 [Convivina intestini]
MRVLKELNNQDYLYIRQSTKLLPDYLTGKVNQSEINDFLNQLNTDGITRPEINQSLWYLNQFAIEQQGAAYQNYDGHKAATIYLPQSLVNQKESVINTVYQEYLKLNQLDKSCIDIQVIPDGQSLFVFNSEATRFNGSKMDMYHTYGSLINQIVVRLNIPMLLDHHDTTLASNILETQGLLSPKTISKIGKLDSNLVSETIEPYQTVLLNISSLKHQLTIANVLQIIMLASVLTSIIAYIWVISRFQILTIVKKRLLGQSILKTFLPYILPPLVAVIISSGFIMVEDNQFFLGLTLIIISTILALLFLLIFSYRIKNHYATLLKGNNE